MTSRVSGPLRIWRSRTARTRGDHAYLAYLILMLTLVTILPLVRAVSLGMTSAPAIALLTSPAAPSVAACAISGIWASALWIGRVRGPALRPPFLTHALASSDLPRATAFRGPLVRAGAITVTLTTVTGALIGATLMSTGHSSPIDALLFVVAGTCVGIISTIAWLVGQAVPRTAALLAPIVVVLGAIITTAPAMQPFTPWGWAGHAYPAAPATGTLVPLLAVTAAAAAAAPALMSRLTLTLLIAQAVRWETATSYVTGMELAAAATVYQAAPKAGRHLRAVRPALRSPLMFLRRDAVGAARTPVRLAAAALALSAATALFTVSVSPEAPNWVLGGIAGVILFAGLGPLTDGIRHAASVAGDLPLYGISDHRLLAAHTLFPGLATITVVVSVSAICALLIGNAIPAILGSLALAMLAIIARIGSALKGSLPPSLLTPIPTPMGDLSAAARLVWAMDGVLLAALAGASAALLFPSPVLLLAVGVSLTGLTIHRWRHRA